MDVVDVAGVRLGFELLDHCGRRVETAVAAVGKRVQHFERWVLQLV